MANRPGVSTTSRILAIVNLNNYTEVVRHLQPFFIKKLIFFNETFFQLKKSSKSEQNQHEKLCYQPKQKQATRDLLSPLFVYLLSITGHEKLVASSQTYKIE